VLSLQPGQTESSEPPKSATQIILKVVSFVNFNLQPF